MPIVLLLIRVAALYFAFSQARSAKKPRIIIKVLDDLFFAPGEQVKVSINLHNRPYSYAQPTATNVCAYVNVDAAVQPLRLRFGTALSNVAEQVTIGKNNSRCLTAHGIVLLSNQSENIEWHAKMPDASGEYELWIDVVANEGLNPPTSYTTRLKVHEFRRMGF
jgi:hypothetical protein